MQIRRYNQSDYDTIQAWWGHRGAMVPQHILPEIGYMVGDEPILSGFLYEDKTTPVKFLTWICSKPNSTGRPLLEAINMLIDTVKADVAQRGGGFIFHCTNRRHLTNMLRHKGFQVTTSGAYEMIMMINGGEQHGN